jgi:PPOX class probable F420-dependent enzyme
MGIAGERYVASTTYRRSGAEVSTRTWIVPLDGGRVGFLTSSRAGKYKRLCNDSKINMQPCNFRGRIRKKSRKLEGTAKLVFSGPEFDAIQTEIRDKYKLMVPLFRFVNTFSHLGRGTFPYDVGVVVSFTPQSQGSKDVKDA